MEFKIFVSRFFDSKEIKRIIVITDKVIRISYDLGIEELSMKKLKLSPSGNIQLRGYSKKWNMKDIIKFLMKV